MKRSIYFFLTSGISLLFSFHLLSQDKSFYVTDTFIDSYNSYSSLSSPEKLYLHTDKSIYGAGETIWVKGYLLNKSYLAELPESRYIYVELFSPDSLVSRIKLKHIDSLGFQGHIELPYTIPSGCYTLRGYSQWMMAFPEPFMFHKQLQIISGRDKGDNQITSDFRQSQLAELNFYPESGRYLTDIPSTIAFKANNKLGRGVEVTGKLFDADGSTITEISTTHAGMGLFHFTPAQGKKYHAVIMDKSGKEIKANFPEPAVSSAIINLTRSQGKVTFYTHLSNDLISKNLMLIMHNGSKLFYHDIVTEAFSRKTLSENVLESGINHIAIVDASGNIYAERMFFVFPPHDIEVELYANKEEYGKREKVEVELNLKDKQGLPIQGTFSLAVTDFFAVPFDPYSETLSSYILLSSELSGAIEEPGYYFTTSISRKQREKALDMLMMVQGWRYYDVPAIITGKATVPIIAKEYNQQLAGKVTTVTSIFKNKKTQWYPL